MAKRRTPIRKLPTHPVIQALRQARIDAGISQYKLASTLDCSRSKIEHLERGHTTNTGFTFLVKWAEALGMEITTDVRVVHENVS